MHVQDGVRCGPIDIYESIFSSNCNSLRTSVQKRFRAGSLIGVNDTWAKALTNRPDHPGGKRILQFGLEYNF